MIRIYQGPVPTGWKEVELRSLVDLKRGYSWSKDQEILKPEPGAVPVIRILNVQEKLLLNQLLYLRGLTDNGIKLSIIDKPAWAAAPRQPDAFAQSSCLV